MMSWRPWSAHRMPLAERELTEDAWRIDDQVLADVLGGNFEKAMNELHAPTTCGECGDGVKGDN